MAPLSPSTGPADDLLPPHLAVQPYACEDCGLRREQGGDCPKGHGPLLDLRDDRVRLMLVENEERRSRGLYGKLLVVSIPLAVGLIVGGSMIIPGLWKVFAVLPFGLGWVGGFGVLGVALNSVLMKVFAPKRKFADLDGL